MCVCVCVCVLCLHVSMSMCELCVFACVCCMMWFDQCRGELDAMVVKRIHTCHANGVSSGGFTCDCGRTFR